MKIASFDNASYKINRDIKQNNLFDLFQKNIVNNTNIQLQLYIVPREYEMRLDRISEYIYGTSDYVEELMIINDIINPYSIKEGQYIYFCDINLFNTLYTKDELNNLDELKRQQLINSSKSNKQLNLDQNLSPTIKPSSLKQIKVNEDNSIQIINSFE